MIYPFRWSEDDPSCWLFVGVVGEWEIGRACGGKSKVDSILVKVLADVRGQSGSGRVCAENHKSSFIFLLFSTIRTC